MIALIASIAMVVIGIGGLSMFGITLRLYPFRAAITTFLGLMAVLGCGLIIFIAFGAVAVGSG